jgi:ABC-2 type transport system ATP-binding protein
MRSLGTKQLIVQLARPMQAIPPELAAWPLKLDAGGASLELAYDAHKERTSVPELLDRLTELGIDYRDLETRQTSLEDIFVKLVGEPA